MPEKPNEEALKDVSGGASFGGINGLETKEYVCQKCGNKYTRSHLAGSCWMFQDATVYCDKCWHEVHDKDK